MLGQSSIWSNNWIKRIGLIQCTQNIYHAFFDRHKTLMFMVSWNISKQKQGAIIMQSLLLSYDNEIRNYYAFVANQMKNAHIM